MDIFGPLYVKLGGGTVKHWTLVVPANLLEHTCDSSRVGPLNGHRWFYNVFLITSFINCRGKVVQLRCERGTTWPTHDVQPITPSHFIMHRKTICLPPAWSFKRTEQFHRRKWRKVKFLADVLWKVGCESIFHYCKLERKGAELYLILNRMLLYFWLTKMHHEVAGTLVALLKCCVFRRLIIMCYSWCWTSNPRRPKRGVGWGGAGRVGKLGSNVVFVKTSQDIIFHFILSFVFLPIFTWHFVELKNSSWRPLRLVETLGGRFSCYFAAQKFSLTSLVTLRRLFETKVK